MYLNVELDGKEEENFLTAKDRIGIKSNTDFVRYIIKRFIFKAYGSFPSSKTKIIDVNDMDFDDPLTDDASIEQAFRRGFMHGFVYCQETPENKQAKVLDLIYDWRYKEPSESMVPPCLFISERIMEEK